MGVSGAAFRLLWNPRTFDGANVDMMLMVPDFREPFRRTFDAVGRTFQMDLPAVGEGVLRDRICRSIREHGRPALAFGVMGPPEPCVITGYDRGGDVLIGWSYYQGWSRFDPNPSTEPCGYFRQTDWFPWTYGLITIGDRTEPAPKLPDVYRSALQWALELARPGRSKGRHTGQDAYAAWAEALLKDGEFRRDSLPVLAQCHEAHDDALKVTVEGRAHAAAFCRDAATHLPHAAGSLKAAAACYDAESTLMQQAWDITPDCSEPNLIKLADRTTRLQLAQLIQEGAAHLESALSQ